jgi:hypothetical protein
LHAEVLAIRQLYGVTYKHAAHLLYMAEIERLKADTQATNSLTRLVTRMDGTVFHELYPPITSIDQGMFDNMEFSGLYHQPAGEAAATRSDNSTEK